MKRYTAHCQSGYYLYERDVTVDRKLSNMPYAQAGIIKTVYSLYPMKRLSRK